VSDEGYAERRDHHLALAKGWLAITQEHIEAGQFGLAAVVAYDVAKALAKADGEHACFLATLKGGAS